mgnify:CR=1 FL=1
MVFLSVYYGNRFYFALLLIAYLGIYRIYDKKTSKSRLFCGGNPKVFCLSSCPIPW